MTAWTRKTMLFVLALGWTFVLPVWGGELKTQNVIILVSDGERYSETWGEHHKKYIHHMARDLAPIGLVYTNFRNDGPTYTNAGHSAICTGFYQEIENSKGTQLPDHSGIFQRFLKATGLSKDSAWVITSKDKLQILINCEDSDWKGKYLASSNCGVNGKGLGSGYREDDETFSEIKRILKQYHPRLVLINLKGPDAMGHANNWKGYLSAIRDNDEKEWNLWEFLQSDPFYKDKTAYFITNDHGRHLDGVANGFIDHGDNCEGCRHIFCFAAGPDFKRNTVVKEKRGQIDLAATCASLLGFKIPGTKGCRMDELFAAEPVIAAGKKKETADSIKP